MTILIGSISSFITNQMTIDYLGKISRLILNSGAAQILSAKPVLSKYLVSILAPVDTILFCNFILNTAGSCL